MSIETPDLQALKRLSSRLGREISLVQAASGNTSQKVSGTLWIKASGKWLADALSDDIFVPVSGGVCAGGRLTPSIETPMHAVLPHPVVVHVHSVNAISWAVRKDGPSRIAERLAGLPWAWIPYVPSGLPLASEIQRNLKPGPAVFVMANHGLVVAAADCEEAESLLAQVEARLASSARKAPGPNRPLLERVARGSNWCVPAEALVHELATCPVSLGFLTGGTLYPCQALFLGQAAAVCGPSETPEAAAERYWQEFGVSPGLIAVEGAGLLVPGGITVTQMQVLVGLALVIQRLGPDARVHYLSRPEIAALLSHDAYRYRDNVEARTALSVS